MSRNLRSFRFFPTEKADFPGIFSKVARINDQNIIRRNLSDYTGEVFRNRAAIENRDGKIARLLR